MESFFNCLDPCAPESQCTECNLTQESEGISRSLRELCLRATISLPPDLEGAVEALDARLDSRFELGLEREAQQNDAPTATAAAGVQSAPADAPVPTGAPAASSAVLGEAAAAAVAVPAMVVEGADLREVSAAAAETAATAVMAQVLIQAWDSHDYVQ